jgi:hypothetical protein
MEAFESVVALALEAERFVVSGAVKFRVKRRTAKAVHEEVQTHGYEVDLVAARADLLVLATVKSFFGSRGVAADDVAGVGRYSAHYKLLNDPVIREGVITAAADRYGYAEDRVRLRLYAGRFAGPVRGIHEARIRGLPGFEVFGPEEIASKLLVVAASKQYRDNPALAAVKLLEAAGRLQGQRSPAGEDALAVTRSGRKGTKQVRSTRGTQPPPASITGSRSPVDPAIGELP